MVLRGLFRDSARLTGFEPLILGLSAERANPLVVSLLNSCHNIILAAILEFFGSQFQAALKFDLFHATILGLPVDIVGRHEQALVGAVLPEHGVANWPLRLPSVRNLDQSVRVSLGEKRAEPFDFWGSNVHLLTRAHAKGDFCTHETGKVELILYLRF